MEISDKVLNLMERHNTNWISDVLNYDCKSTYQKIFNNLLIYGLKTRKYIQKSKPEILRIYGLP